MAWADARGDSPTALALYLQAASELEAFAAASQGGARSEEEVAGARPHAPARARGHPALPRHTSLTPDRSHPRQGGRIPRARRGAAGAGAALPQRSASPRGDPRPLAPAPDLTPARLPQAQAAQLQASLRAAHGVSAVAQQGGQAVRRAGGTATMSAAAAVGGVAGFLLLGPVAAVAAAGVAAYATTRRDGVGSAARAPGQGAVAAAHAASEFDAKHGITTKAKACVVAPGGSGERCERAGSLAPRPPTKAAALAAAEKAKEINTKYGVAEKLQSGVASAVNKAKEVEHKHHVTEKVGNALSSGLERLAAALDGSGRPAQPGPPRGWARDPRAGARRLAQANPAEAIARA
jgi:hypothetical protein